MPAPISAPEGPPILEFVAVPGTPYADARSGARLLLTRRGLLVARVSASS